MKRPMLFIAICAVVMAVLSFYFEIFTFIALGLCLLLIVIFSVLKRKVAAISFVVLVLFCFSVIFNHSEVSDFQKLDGQGRRVRAVAIEDSRSSNGYTDVTVRLYAKGLPYGCKANLNLKGVNFVGAGEIIDATVTLESLEDSKYKIFNYSNGIFYSATLKNLIDITGENAFYRGLQSVRDYVTDTLFSNLSFEVAAVTNAVLTGDDSYMSKEFVEKTKLTGVNHAMVVSGQHLAIFVTAIFGVIDRLIYNRYFRFVTCLAVVVFITAVCGFSLSILRAAVMFMCTAAAPLFYRRADPLSSLSAAVFLILLFNPFAIFNVGFQLSVLATLGLVVFSPYFSLKSELFLKKYDMHPMVPVAKIVATCLSATVMTLPVLIYVFGYVSSITVLTNLIITYPVTGVLMFSAVSMLLSPFKFIFKPIILLCGICSDFVIRAVNRVSEFSGATIDFNNDFERYAATVLSLMVIILLLLVMTACKKRDNLLKLKGIKPKENRGNLLADDL